MDRKPEHLEQDPMLRVKFVEQVSWDEWALANAPFFLHPEGRQMVEEQMKAMGVEATYEDALAVAVAKWRATLDPGTNVSEFYYLQGLSYEQRLSIIEQQHAELLRRAVEMGIVDERPEDAEFREQFGD